MGQYRPDRNNDAQAVPAEALFKGLGCASLSAQPLGTPPPPSPRPAGPFSFQSPDPSLPQGVARAAARRARRTRNRPGGPRPAHERPSPASAQVLPLPAAGDALRRLTSHPPRARATPPACSKPPASCARRRASAGPRRPGPAAGTRQGRGPRSSARAPWGGRGGVRSGEVRLGDALTDVTLGFGAHSNGWAGG